MLAVATMFGQVIVRTKLPQALVTLTPPYGMTTFITARILDMPMLRLAKAMLPWMLALLLRADRGILTADCHVAATSDGIRKKI